MKKISVRADRLPLYFVIYSGLSALAFSLTYGGWSTFLQLLSWGMLYAVFLVLFFVSNSFRLKNKIILLDVWYLILIFVTQCWALLFNVGDCGDVQGSYNFIQKIISPTSICTNASSAQPSLAPFIYVVLLIILLFLIGTKSHRKAKESREPTT
jgi:hypothetical protein